MYVQMMKMLDALDVYFSVDLRSQYCDGKVSTLSSFWKRSDEDVADLEWFPQHNTHCWDDGDVLAYCSMSFDTHMHHLDLWHYCWNSLFHCWLTPKLLDPARPVLGLQRDPYLD